MWVRNLSAVFGRKPAVVDGCGSKAVDGCGSKAVDGCGSKADGTVTIEYPATGFRTRQQGLRADAVRCLYDGEYASGAREGQGKFRYEATAHTARLG